jgi:hypothetical protein
MGWTMLEISSVLTDHPSNHPKSPDLTRLSSYPDLQSWQSIQAPSNQYPRSFLGRDISHGFNGGMDLFG